MKKVVGAVFLLVTFAWAPAMVGARAQERQGAPAAAKPKLVVFIVVDQMRADYPVRYASLLEHGLKRLTTGGAWYKNAAYPYMTTVTCVGHSTMGTGTFPYRHGMIGNSWWDRGSEKSVTCNA